MAKQVVPIEVDVPDGWEAVAYRPYVDGEWYLHATGPRQGDCQAIYPWLILRKVEPVRESRWALLHKTPGFWVMGSLFNRPDIPKDDARRHGERYIRIELENNKVVSVTLEPAEGGA